MYLGTKEINYNEGLTYREKLVNLGRSVRRSFLLKKETPSSVVREIVPVTRVIIEKLVQM